MEYGKKPEGMSPADWTVECQCRHIARAMKQARDKTERNAIFERESKRFPAATRARVAEIWRQGVPMPTRGRG